MANYTIKEFTPDILGALAPLMNSCFGMNAGLDYFKWKYLDNPAGGVLAYYALADDGEIAAFTGVNPGWYAADGKPFRIFQCVDAMTQAAHRRQGLFEKLVRTYDDTLRKQGELFTIAFGSEASTPVFTKTGRKALFPIWFHFKPALICRAENMLRSFARPKGDFQTEYVPVSALGPLLPLIQQNTGTARIAQIRSAEFIQWRLLNPLHKYQILAVKQNGVYTGYCIYYTENSKLMIFDYYGENRVAEKVMMLVLNSEAVKLKLQGMVTFSQLGTGFSDRLLRNGFMINKTGYGPMKTPLKHLFYADDERLKQFSDSKAWSVSPFDHDSF